MTGHAMIHRMKRPGDEPALIELWNSHAGWGSANLDLWNNLMVHGPHGEAPVAIAEDVDSGTIVGQLVFLPAVVSVRGRRVRALRPFAAILAPSARQARSVSITSHPVVDLYRFGLTQLRPAGYDLIYCLPNPAWVPVFKMLRSFQCHSFPTWAFQRPADGTPQLPAGYVATALLNWDGRVDALQSAASSRHGCFVYRSAKELEKRCATFHLQATAVERGGVLMGLALHTSTLIADVLAMDAGDALTATIVAATQAAGRRATSSNGGAISVLASPALQPVLRQIGFRPGTYSYPLVVQPLDASLDSADIAPHEWYVTALD